MNYSLKQCIESFRDWWDSLPPSLAKKSDRPTAWLGWHSAWMKFSTGSVKAVATQHEWADCPVCGGTDMFKETDEYGDSLIHCVNLSCRSNGGNTDIKEQP